MPRHCYAIRYAYPGAISAGDVLTRFDSQQARASFCERFPEYEPVTLESVRHRFDVRQFAADYQELYTQAGDTIRYIYQRPGYDL